MRKCIALAAIFAFGMTSGCGRSQDDESGGPTVSRNYQVGNFQQIEVAGPYDVDVRTRGNPTVSASGPQRLLDNAVVEVEGDKLLIHPKQHNGMFSMSWSGHDKAQFTVAVPRLSGAAIGGSGNIHVDHVRADRFEGGVGGSGQLKVDTVEAKLLKLSIGGSGSANVGAGKVETSEYSIGGSGDIHAGGVQAVNAKVSIAGSGEVVANASGTAEVSMMGSGDVTITGGAKCSVSKHGSGDVHCS